jgi:hypothetical protein
MRCKQTRHVTRRGRRVGTRVNAKSLYAFQRCTLTPNPFPIANGGRSKQRPYTIRNLP